MATRKSQSKKKAAKKAASATSAKKKASGTAAPQRASNASKKSASKRTAKKATPRKKATPTKKATPRKKAAAKKSNSRSTTSSGAKTDTGSNTDNDLENESPLVADPPSVEAASRHIWEIVWVRDLFMIALAVLLSWFLYSHRAITLPVMLGLLLAYLFNPLVTIMDKHYSVSRTVSATAILLLCVCVVALGTRLFVPTLVTQANQLYGQRDSLLSGIQVIHDLGVEVGLLKEDPAKKNAPDPDNSTNTNSNTNSNANQNASPNSNTAPNNNANTATNPDPNTAPIPPPHDEVTLLDGTRLVGDIVDTRDGNLVIETKAAGELKIPVDQIKAVNRNANKNNATNASLKQTSADARKAVGQLVFKALGIGYGLLSGVFDWVVYTVLFATIIGFCFFFFTRDFNAIIRWASQFVPAKHQAHAAHLAKKMDRSVSAFVRGRMVQSLLMAINLSIGWAVVGWFWPNLAVPYFLIIAVLGGVLNLVPYAGFVACISAIALTWFDRLSGGTEITPTLGIAITLVPALVFALAQIIDSWIIEPLVQGHATNLSPLAILLAVLIGGSVAGILGLIVAIPVASCLKILAKEVIVPHLKQYVQQLP